MELQIGLISGSVEHVKDYIMENMFSYASISFINNLKTIEIPLLTNELGFFSIKSRILPSASTSRDSPDDLRSARYFFCLERILCML